MVEVMGAYKTLTGKHTGRRFLEGLGVVERTILELNLN